MMQIRVKNTTGGSRGVYIGGELVFVDKNSTGTFTGATADERDAASKIEGLKVQSRLGHDGDWTDHFEEQMPEEKPWIAVATDDQGGNMRLIDGAPWYIGTAVASERPDSAAGYKWTKVGASDEEMPVPVVAPVPAPVTEDIKVDYAELVKGNAADVTKAVTRDNALDIGAAEEAREGGARKGVMKAVEEAMEGDK